MKKFLSISLVFLLLLSHLSLAVGMHFCGGMVVKTELMFGHQHLDCGMSGMDEENNANNTLPHFEKIPCCQNEYSSFEVEEDFKIPSPEKTLNFEFAFVFVSSFLRPVLLEEVAFSQFKYFPPPIPDRDIQVLFQTFLI